MAANMAGALMARIYQANSVHQNIPVMVNVANLDEEINCLVSNSVINKMPCLLEDKLEYILNYYAQEAFFF